MVIWSFDAASFYESKGRGSQMHVWVDSDVHFISFFFFFSFFRSLIDTSCIMRGFWSWEAEVDCLLCSSELWVRKKGFFIFLGDPRTFLHEGAQVTASDIEPDLTLLKKQIAKANADVRVVELLWGEKGWNQSVVKNEPSYDFVFCADLIAIDEAHEDLLWTLRCRIMLNVVWRSVLIWVFRKLIGKDTICFFGFKNRDDFSLNFFAMLHDTLEFDLEEELDVDRDNVEDGEEVLIYKITRKK